MRRLRAAAPDAICAALVALVVFAYFGHAFLNYDSFYALAWGDQIARGETPDYDQPIAPTPHPLLIAAGAAVSPLGDAAEDVLLALLLVGGIGAATVGLFRLGRIRFGWAVGLLAAAILVTRVPLLNFGIRGYVDLPALALVIWAAVLEARRPRRGAAVLVLLGVAGLLRPEAWLLSVAYWLWLAPPLDLRARVRLGALAVAAPLLWMLSDLLVTGDPLWSLNGTSDLAADLGRPRGLDDVPSVAPRRLGEIVRLPELLAAVGGIVAATALRWPRTLLPLAVAALNGVAFLVFAVFGLPLLGRYLFVAAAMLCLLAAVGALGWLELPRHHQRRRAWKAAGLAALAAIAVAFAVQQADRLGDLRDDIADRDRVQADLLDLVRSGPAERALDRCGELFVPNHRQVPALAYWTDRDPGEIVSAQLRRPTPDGLFIAPANEEVERLSVLDPRDPRRLDAEVPAGYRVIVRNRSWVLYAGCGG